MAMSVVKRSVARMWLAIVLSSLAAAALALVLMFWARATLQVRSLPERIMESVLLLIPPAQFEGAIEKYGPAAKEYALDGATLVMFLVLAGIGILALRFIHRPAGLLLVGIGLWLVAMVAIMPLTGAGFFATALFQSPALIAVIYLGIGLAYASVLLLGWLTAFPAAAGPPVEAPMFAFPGRRAFLAGAGGTAAAFVATLVLGKGSTQVASGLPLASLPPTDQRGPAATTTSTTSPASGNNGASGSGSAASSGSPGAGQAAGAGSGGSGSPGAGQAPGTGSAGSGSPGAGQAAGTGSAGSGSPGTGQAAGTGSAGTGSAGSGSPGAGQAAGTGSAAGAGSPGTSQGAPAGSPGSGQGAGSGSISPAGAGSGEPAAAGSGRGAGTGASSGSSAQGGSAGASTQAAPSAIDYPNPPPEKPLARDKDGALLAVKRTKGQLQPAITPNDDWYTVTKNAGGDPRLEARDWRLIVDGAVNRPVQLDYATLVRLPQVNLYKSLECISNLTAKCELTSFGCDLISTAKWTGARLPDVLNLAGGLKRGVVAIAAVGADEFSSALPASAASDPEVLLAYRMNDQPLPREHGFPVRVLIPDRYGMKNAKWIINIKPMTQAYVDWYGQRNWNQQGIVKTMSRIDVPAANAKLQAGTNPIEGIAYAGNRGIAKVEFSLSQSAATEGSDIRQSRHRQGGVQLRRRPFVAAGHAGSRARQ